jgi:hypothetical protein
MYGQVLKDASVRRWVLLSEARQKRHDANPSHWQGFMSSLGDVKGSQEHMRAKTISQPDNGINHISVAEVSRGQRGSLPVAVHDESLR